MEKKSQSLMVVWVGMLLLLTFGIGIAGYLGHTEPSRLGSAPSPLSNNALPPGLKVPAAYVPPDTPAASIGTAPYGSPVALANGNAQLTAATNEITVSIFEQGNVIGQKQFLGSGVIVTADSVLTDAHIINNRGNLFIYVFAPQSATYPVVLFRCDPMNDLALLKITGNSKFVSVGLVGDPNDVVVGDSVFAMGNVNGNGNQLMEGVILDKRFRVLVNGQEFVRMRTNIILSTGICGGPLVNRQGEVIGVNNSLGNPETVTAIDRALPLIYGKNQNPGIVTTPTQVV